MYGGERDSKGFTIRERLLVADYLRTLGANATESAKRAGYSGNRNVLGVTAYEVLRRPKIAREINRRMKAKLSTDQIESEIADVALSDVLIDAPAKMKALDLLAKINGMITSKVESIDLTQQSAAESALLKSIQLAAKRDDLSPENAAIQLFAALKDDPQLSDVNTWPAEYRVAIQQSQQVNSNEISEIAGEQ